MPCHNFGSVKNSRRPALSLRPRRFAPPELPEVFPNVREVFPNVSEVFPKLRERSRTFGSVPECLGSLPKCLGSLPECLGSLPETLGTLPVPRGRIAADRSAVFQWAESNSQSRKLRLVRSLISVPVCARGRFESVFRALSKTSIYKIETSARKSFCGRLGGL